jgi:DMSO/TMAO reductase YedYZ heme-binding membrane subunit/nitrite reductase/ring-hydroxylating ferredoxin subunit
MSVQYRAVSWSRQKRIYDTVVAAGVVLYLGLFASIGAVLHPNATIETLLIRALGTCSLLLLHIILAVGPLCRLNRRFLPLLYNRRHLGVTMFMLAFAHGAFSLVQFHSLGNTDPIISLLTSTTRFNSLAGLPFQQFGFAALLILFLMAATSHDFWLHTLSPPIWKCLHMLVYAAYLLLVVHVAFGTIQSERSSFYPMLLGLGFAVLIALHVAAASRERNRDRATAGLIRVGSVHEIPDSRAVVVATPAERVAVFRYGDSISAISNVCRHQNGPLGEGRIIDGCVTCPWHGYQYDPVTGCSPPPFTDKVPLYRTSIIDGIVYVDPAPVPAETVVASRIGRDRAVAG